ncbi:MAG TPA: 4-amino-4-deoxy-L-arabinose transferase, partial [Casimicrobiaceae bacterium]
ILPLFPAAALCIGWQIERLSQPILYRWTLAAVLAAAIALVGLSIGYDALAHRLADARTPLAIYRQFGPWLIAALGVGTAGGIAALVAFARDSRARRSIGIIVITLTTLVATQVAFVGNDAFRATRSAADLATTLTSAQPPYDSNAPFYQIEMYDQTLPFYLRRTTTLVNYRDELALGLDAEPERGMATVRAWETRWRELPQAYALMAPETFDRLKAADVPLRIVARDTRRVLVARR